MSSLQNLAFTVASSGVGVSASLGLAVKATPEQILDDALCTADELMYEQKRLDSAQMRQRTIDNTLDVATREDLIRPLTPHEDHLLVMFRLRCGCA